MNRTLTVLVCIMVAGVVVGASLPIFDSLTASSESVHNDGAGWVRFALDRNAGTTYTLSYTSDDDGFYIDNGTDRQTYDDSSTVNFDTILYADSNLSVWCDVDIHILGTIEGNPVYLEGNGAITIVRDAEGVTISSEGTDLARFGVPTWAYIPVSTGNYGFFYAADLDDELGNGVKNYPSDMPLAVVGGGNVGVYAYNDIYRYNGLGLYMHPVYDDDGLFYGAYWDTTAPAEIESDDLNIIDPFNPDDVVFDPIDIQPIDIDPLDPGMQIMSVPTPTYTDGDWGYDLMDVDGVTKAKIVSYSGTGGAVTVPSTVGGYTVYQFGKDVGNANVIPTSTTGTDLIIPEGVERIGMYALMECIFTGSVTIPSTVSYIGNYAFCLTHFSNALELPNNLTYIGTQAFAGAQYLTGNVTIPDSVTSIGDSAFQNCSGLTGMIIGEGVTTIGSNTFKGCSGLTSLVIPSGLTSIGSSAFNGCTSLAGSIIIPKGVTSIGSSAFNGCSGLNGTLVIPKAVETLSQNAFKSTKFTNVIISSDATPGNQALYISDVTDVLDLSDTIDYSVNHYLLPSTATYYDTIGYCFGFISVVDYTIPAADGGAVSTLISILPLVMVVGLVLVAIGMVVWNRMM